MSERIIRPPIRIVLADDHPLLRSGVRAALEANDDLVVVGEADDGYQVVPCCRETLPDVLLLDLQMPGPGHWRSWPIFGRTARRSRFWC
jgi:DNA-binding NarL/FixJ family response regulator